MRFKNDFLFLFKILIFLNLIVFAISYTPLNVRSAPRKKLKDRLLEQFADNINSYFELNKLVEANNAMRNMPDDATTTSAESNQGNDENNSGCNTTEEITDYFFKVYSDRSNQSYISSSKMDEMIKYQVLGHPKSKLIQARTDKHKCARRECFRSQNIFDLAGNQGIDYETFLKICPVMLYNFEIHRCEYGDDDGGLEEWQKWLIGMALSGVVTIWSWNGAIVFPIIQKNYFKLCLTFMISLAYGCLTCNSLLNYIPLADGFDDTNIEDTEYTYFLKHLVILAVLFFFFNFERFMKIFAIYRTQKFKQKKKEKELLQAYLSRDNKRPSEFMRELSDISDQYDDSLKPSESTVTFNLQDDDNDDTNAGKKKSASEKYKNKKATQQKMKRNQSIDLGEVNFVGVQGLNETTDKLAAKLNEKKKSDDDSDDEDTFVISKSGRICCTSLSEGLSEVRPIGWMAIFGDGLGNFIDGLSIGASISQSIGLGLTTALATWFANIPQELGDFALLVRSGMTPFQALFYNFMSAQSAYIGCAIGIIFGSDLNSARWIFSISGATALYLGLAVLLPEMKEEFDKNKGPLKEKFLITFIQLFGMMIGITIMVILNMYEDAISI